MNKRIDDETSKRVGQILQELGIAASYPATCGLPQQAECSNLVDTELDVFGRQPRLEANAFSAWSAMKLAAGSAGITLQIISAYRSIGYQKELFQRKLARGDSIAAILQVNVAPGFSEHHSGCALDIGSPGFPHLEVEFENSPAFAWLRKHAASFGFFLSFPKDNAFGVQYEPWHWCYSGQKRTGRRSKQG